MIGVLLVDDHLVVRAGLRALIEATAHVEVVGEASSGEEAVRKAETLEPDVVIMDLAMPGIDGIQATRSIAALELDTKVLVLTIHDEDEFLLPAMEAGAAGFLNKSAADTELISAIDAVARGHSYLPRRAAALIAQRRAQQPSKSASESVASLSARERSVIELYARGYSARQAAKEMFVSPKTVEGYIARAKSKLGLKGRRDIVRFALEAGLLGRDVESDSDA